MAKYTVFICTDAGATIDIFDASLINSLSYVLAENEINAVEIVLPQLWPWDYFDVDQLIIIQRDAGQGPYIEAERAFMLQDWEYYSDENNMQWIRLIGVDGNDIPNRYIVAYAKGSSQAKKTDQYDDIIKLVAAENFGASATDTARSLASYLTIASGRGDAPTSEEMEFSYKNCFNVFQDCADASLEAGTRLIFDIAYTGAGTWRLETYINQRGMDHSLGSPEQRYIKIWKPVMSRLHSDEKNYIYCGGKGDGTARTVKTAYGTDYLRSRWARREGWADARKADTPAAIQTAANAELLKNKYKTNIVGELLEGEGFQYGIDYEWGDIVGITYNGQSFNVHIAAVDVSVTGGQDKVVAVLRSDD